jgi:hypothetical protein
LSRILTLLILGFLALLIVFAAFLLDRRLDQEMAVLKQAIIDRMEARLGRRITYGSLSPSIFGFLDIRDLQIAGRLPAADPGSPGRPQVAGGPALDSPGGFLRINHLRIHYNLLEFLLDRDLAQSISGISISHSVFSVDFKRDRTLLLLIRDLLDQASRDRPQEGQPVSPSIRISGADITLNLKSDGQELHLTRLFFTLSTLPESYQLAFRSFVEVEVAGSTPIGGGFRASSRVRMSGKIDRELAWSDLLLRVYSLKTDTFSLQRQTFQVTFQEGRMEVRKIQDRAPIDFKLVYVPDSRQMDIHVMSQDFKASSMLSVSGPLSRYALLLDSPLTVSGSMSYLPAAGSIRYALDLETRTVLSGLLPTALQLSARIAGDEKIIHLQPLVVHSELGSLEFFGNVLLANLYPDGLLKLIDVRAYSREHLNASVLLQRGGQAVRVRGEVVRLGPLELRNLDLELTPEPSRFRFALNTALAGASPYGTIRSQGQLVLRPGTLPRVELQVAGSLAQVSLETLARLLETVRPVPPEVQPIIRGLCITTSLELSTDLRDFRLTAPDVQVFDTRDSNRWFTTALTADRKSIDLRGSTLRWGPYRLSGDLLTRLGPEPAMSVRTAFTWEGVPYSLEALYVFGKRLQVSGSYGLSAEASLSASNSVASLRLLPGVSVPAPLLRIGGIRFSLRAQDMPVPLPGKIGVVRTTARVEGSVAPDGRLSLDSSQVAVSDFPLLGSRKNRLEAAFSFERDLLQLNRLVFTDAVSTLEGTGRVAFSSLREFDGTLKLGGKNGEEYSLHLNPRGDHVLSAVTFSRAPIRRFGDFLVNGSLSGEARMEGTLDRPRIDGSLTLNDGRLNDDPIGLSFSFRYRPEEISLTGLNLAYLSHRIQEGTGRVDAARGEFQFQSQYAGEHFAQKMRLKVQLAGTFSGQGPTILGTSLEQARIRGRVQCTDIDVAGKAYPLWGFQFQAENRSLSFFGGTHDSIQGQIAMDGGFRIKLQSPLPIQGELAGTVKGREIQSDFRVTHLDLRVIDFIAPNGVFHFTSGSGRGNLRISGAINDPDFFGELAVSKGGLDFALSPNPVGPVEGLLAFNEKTFVLQRTVTWAGQAEVVASGSFTIDHWVPNTFELFFNVTDKSGLQLRYKFGPVLADGYAWGNVQVRGDESSLEVTGEVLADRCQITLETPAAKTPRRKTPLSVELGITTGKRVEFFWPSANLPILRAFAKQGERVHLISNDADGTFGMNGTVEIRGGEVFYFDRSFYLKQGAITFRETEVEFDPRIEALAELRERDQNNEQIRVYLEANNKLSQFSPRFYSVPSRSDAEIIGLLGGSITDRVAESGWFSAVLLTSELGSQFAILRPFEQAVRELLGLDMFSIRTQMLQNVLFGKLFGASIPGELPNPLDNTTLSLGKYLGTDLFLEMLVRFQSMDVTSAGFGTGSSGNQIRTEGEIVFEWQTPLFLLEWTFTPQHPETLFLTDNTLGISWGLSY